MRCVNVSQAVPPFFELWSEYPVFRTVGKSRSKQRCQFRVGLDVIPERLDTGDVFIVRTRQPISTKKPAASMYTNYLRRTLLIALVSEREDHEIPCGFLRNTCWWQVRSYTTLTGRNPEIQTLMKTLATNATFVQFEVTVIFSFRYHARVLRVGLKILAVIVVDFYRNEFRHIPTSFPTRDGLFGCVVQFA